MAKNNVRAITSSIFATALLIAGLALAPHEAAAQIAKNVAANDYVDWYGALRLDSADFLVGGASANTTLTIQGEGEIGVAG